MRTRNESERCMMKMDGESLWQGHTLNPVGTVSCIQQLNTGQYSRFLVDAKSLQFGSYLAGRHAQALKDSAKAANARAAEAERGCRRVETHYRLDDLVRRYEELFFPTTKA